VIETLGLAVRKLYEAWSNPSGDLEELDSKECLTGVQRNHCNLSWAVVLGSWDLGLTADSVDVAAHDGDGLPPMLTDGEVPLNSRP
jgi:hypothetical protein